ncbi:MAG: hypothetical protein Q8Q17_03520, partial [bacterium]|nr:hypothetical protein [bacterium]
GAAIPMPTLPCKYKISVEVASRLMVLAEAMLAPKTANKRKLAKIQSGILVFNFRRLNLRYLEIAALRSQRRVAEFNLQYIAVVRLPSTVLRTSRSP